MHAILRLTTKDGILHSTYKLCTGVVGKAPRQILKHLWCIGSKSFKLESAAVAKIGEAY